MSDLQPIYEGDELVGYLGFTDEGVAVGFDPAIAPIAAFDVDGTELDPSGFTYEGGEQDAYDEHAAAIEERLAELEQRASQPLPVEYVSNDQPDWQRFDEDVGLQANELESPDLLDRPLTISERRRLHQEASVDVLAGDQRPDLIEAAMRSGGLTDIDAAHRGLAHENRRNWMTERLADLNRVEDYQAGYDDLGPVAPPSQATYNRNDRKERQAWMVDALRGATDAGSLVSESDFDAQEG